MATDLTKARRKRTTKKNVMIKEFMPECEDIVTRYRTEESSEDANAIIQMLEDKR